MRTPNHLEIKKICRQCIEPISKKWGLGAVHDIRFDDQGWVNVTAFVNDLFVIRFNARDVHLPKFKREEIVYTSFKEVLPLPELIGLDDSKTLAPFDYMITKKVVGTNLEVGWNSLSVRDRDSLSYQAGKLLAKIHSIKLDKFGEISERPPFSKTNSWKIYLKSLLDYHLEEARSLGIFQATSYQQFQDAFNESSDIFDSINCSTLVHGDFHFGNLLFQDDKIVSILDFEWSCSGDPLMDFCSHIDDMNTKWPGSQCGFYAGYGIKDFSKDDLSKIKVYNMVKNIELCVVAKKFFPKDEFIDYVAITETNYLPKD